MGFHCLCRASGSSGTGHLSPGSPLESSACFLASPCPCCGHSLLFALSVLAAQGFHKGPFTPLPPSLALWPQTHTGLSCTASSESFLPPVLSAAIQGV